MSADTIDRILRLLKNDDVEVRCAAALVLGRLRPLEEKVVKALRLGMKKAPAHAKSYFLDALLQTKDSQVVPDIVALLDEKGSIVDQAVSVLRQFGGAALEAIAERHKGEQAWRNGAYIKAVAGIHQVRAAKMLMERLPYTSWEEARGTSLFIAEHYRRYPKTAQKYLEKAICGMIAEPPAELPAYALVTCLKLVRKLRLKMDSAALLKHAEESDTPSLRRHALEALENQKPTPDQIAEFRERLFSLLMQDNSDVTIPSAAVLNSWREPRLPAKVLRALAEREGPALKDWVFFELVRRRDRQAAEILCQHLDHPSRYTRRSAATALTRLKDGSRTLFEYFNACDDADLRREIAEVLANSNLELEEKELKTLRKQLADGFLHARIDHGTLLYLGMRDRMETNSFMIRRAKKLIKEGRAEVAIHSLQPLVRFRHGSHEARFVLAIANFEAADDVMDDRDRRYQRCIDILSPLARVHDFDLGAKVKRTKSLNTKDRVAILRGLAQRGGMERSVCRTIVESIDADALDTEDQTTLDGVRKLLGS